MINAFPYTDVHQLNLDYILAKIKELEKIQVKNMAPADTIINIADVVDAPLSNDNIVDAINKALAISSYIFIPNGKYTFNISLYQDCNIIMDKDAVIQSDSASPCIEMHNSRFTLTGGSVESGLNDDSRTLYGDILSAIITCYDCHDIHIEQVHSGHSKHAAVFCFEDCTNVNVENCYFNNFLMSAVRLLDYNKNVRVANCVFMYSKRPTGHEYCYFFCTGARQTSLSYTMTPPDGILVENCYGYDSEDCGIDTHGARNVVFRNNVILQTICALTAYNDNGRVGRPADWHMENVLLENNYCESDRDNEPGRLYPHPFIFLGGGNGHTEDEVGYESQYATYYDFCNCIVRGNYFASSNTFTNAQLYLAYVSRNVTIENNVMDCHGVNRTIQPSRSINITVRNNTFKNAVGTSSFIGCLGIFENNVGPRYYATSSSDPSCIEGLMQSVTNTGVTRLVNYGFIYDDSGTAKITTSYGIRYRADLTPPAAINITVAGGVATVDSGSSHHLLPGMAVTLTDGGGTTYNRYIRDVLDFKRFSVISGSNADQADGSYTLAVKQATASTL